MLNSHTNPILQAFRDEAVDGWAGDTHEWLFQLTRHWAAWQSARIGTFPLDYRDPSGPLPRDDSEDTGEDAVYWEINDIIEEDLVGNLDENGIQDMIVHATYVLIHLDNWYELTGRGI